MVLCFNKSFAVFIESTVPDCTVFNKLNKGKGNRSKSNLQVWQEVHLSKRENIIIHGQPCSL